MSEFKIPLTRRFGYVSDYFDETKIATRILGGLGCLSTSSQVSLQHLLENISEKIKETKLFLVFDDVWEDGDEDWKALRGTLKHCKHGSRVLVTTRKDSVVEVMRSSSAHVFRLEPLSDEVCWDIVKQKAFRGRAERECDDLKDVGMQIARKCKGSPLAAKTSGSLLLGKRKDGWEKVLSSGFWELQIIKENIFRPLLLSYYDLPSAIRRSLLYCAIFPKDYVMSRDELILHWKVQGFLNSDDDSEGEDCFDFLAGRSFFQDFAKDASGYICECKMHDLIHDFLLFMTEDEIVEKDVKSGTPLSLDSVSKKPRHSRITIGEGNTFPMSITGVEKLRSLVTIGHKCVVTREALKNLFDKTKRLRLLEFGLSTRSSAAVVEEVPEEIRHLVHLRYLSFRCSYDLRMPDSVCELQNLLYLNLFSCINLSKLPDGIEHLVNLRYLYTEACISLKYYPKGIGKLTGLRRLDRVIARVDRNYPSAFSVGDLENLDKLCGDLQLDMEGNSIDWEEVERAKLHKKVCLKRLGMTWKMLNGELAGQDKKDELIQALKPHPNLLPQWK